MTAREEFDRWFVEPLLQVRKDPRAGFVLLMVSIPLLERYLRQKTGVAEGTLTPQFYAELEAVFPALQGRGRDFYACFRNGLLHQAAFSLRTTQGTERILPGAGISGYDVRPVYFDASVGCFFMNPQTFYDQIIDVVTADFETYLGVSSEGHPLPRELFPSTFNPATTITISNYSRLPSE